jgi:hypothetical protein
MVRERREGERDREREREREKVFVCDFYIMRVFLNQLCCSWAQGKLKIFKMVAGVGEGITFGIP